MAPLASARFDAFEPVAKQLQHLEIISRCSFDGENEKIMRLCVIIGPIYCILHNPWPMQHLEKYKRSKETRSEPKWKQENMFHKKTTCGRESNHWKVFARWGWGWDEGNRVHTYITFSAMYMLCEVARWAHATMHPRSTCLVLSLADRIQQCKKGRVDCRDNSSSPLGILTTVTSPNSNRLHSRIHMCEKKWINA